MLKPTLSLVDVRGGVAQAQPRCVRQLDELINLEEPGMAIKDGAPGRHLSHRRVEVEVELPEVVGNVATGGD